MYIQSSQLNLKWHEYKDIAERGCFNICSSTMQMEHTVVLQWQQWLRKHTMLLRYTYIAHLVLILFIYLFGNKEG